MADIDLDNILLRLRRMLVTAKATADDRVADMAAGRATHMHFDQLLHEIRTLLLMIDEAQGAPGMGNFVKQLYGLPALDVAQKLNAVEAAAETVAATIRADAPKGTGDYVLGYTYAADPRADDLRAWRSYTSGQTATLQTQVAAVSTAITDFFAAISGQA